MRCPECNKQMVFDTRNEKVKNVSVNVKGWYCDHCGEAVFEADSLQKLEEVFQLLKEDFK